MVKSKRLNVEYKNLSSLIYIKEVNIIDEFSWIVIFCEIKSKIIKIEFKFSNYPLYPPDIKIIEPKQIGSIADSQQNIKIPLTNPNTWEITNNLSQICLFLYNCFTESI
jgi:ubiquitin-protein ligase